MWKSKKISANFKRIEWMVIEEADRLFEDSEKGFREQVITFYYEIEKEIEKNIDN